MKNLPRMRDKNEFGRFADVCLLLDSGLRRITSDLAHVSSRLVEWLLVLPMTRFCTHELFG